MSGIGKSKATRGFALLALAAALASWRVWSAECAVGEPLANLVVAGSRPESAVVKSSLVSAIAAGEERERERDARACESQRCACRDGVPECAAITERAELVMGTVARVAIGEPSVAPEAFEAAFAALRDVDAAMSLYRPESELVRVNSHAAAHPEPVGPELFALLTRARALSVETDGAFDVTVLPLLRLWGAYPELTYLGTGNRGTVGFASLWLDPQARTVSFRRQGMGLDLGGVAKGFALDRARAALAAAGVQSARLDLGGSLAFLGGGPGGDWHVAVRDPDAPETPLGVLGLEPDAAVSTSANYERDFVAEGWRAQSHVYDPRSGRPVLRPLAVTAWATDAITADALSTALLVLGPEGAAPVLEREPQAGALFVEGAGRARRLTIHGRPPRAWVEGAAAARVWAAGGAAGQALGRGRCDGHAGALLRRADVGEPGSQ